MGCGASTFDFDAPVVKPKTTQINPRLHHRIEKFKRRRRGNSLKKLTPSKKELLGHHSDEEVGESISHGGFRGDEEEETLGDDRDDERRIGNNNEGVFPGSPSFRIYFMENADDDKIDCDNENPQLKETTFNSQNAAQNKLAESLKDSVTMAEKKGRKRMGFAKAMRGRKLTCY